ncbi:MAG: hypothetical protein HZA89_09640 [Verrucomicrobia bacterium]|nr:hypothetical protein [Verrucomicrobiota bacterium]
MTHGHGFWFWLVWACVIWYSTITIYVSVKGALDIKQMLRDLKEREQKRQASDAEVETRHGNDQAK